MEVECVLLDLDDTLYPERDYFESGVHAVVEWLAAYHGQDVKDVYSRVITDLQKNGRIGLFDRITVPSSLNKDTWKKALLHVYRTHRPKIQLFPRAKHLFEFCREQGFKLGLVTDGKSRVQWRKIDSLELQQWFDLILCTDDIDTCKPDQDVFEIALMRLNVEANQCVYIADDTSKDFIAPCELGMGTIRIRHSVEYPLAAGKPNLQDAEIIVEDFDEIIALLSR